ncbi:hypothetical protein NSU_0897 [Novosphingobium pentaromativorans US6-1]|uniref:Uncharacterized protein n=2 Tax=Novosphingobium pentaromativorans TaxID=205844 RepID=G6E976_9SPHN|nr:hypothetical protein NSU_0897 [Novosphingobium pentaromativorans US6-1]
MPTSTPEVTEEFTFTEPFSLETDLGYSVATFKGNGTSILEGVSIFKGDDRAYLTLRLEPDAITYDFPRIISETYTSDTLQNGPIWRIYGKNEDRLIIEHDAKSAILVTRLTKSNSSYFGQIGERITYRQAIFGRDEPFDMPARDFSDYEGRVYGYFESESLADKQILGTCNFNYTPSVNRLSGSASFVYQSKQVATMSFVSSLDRESKTFSGNVADASTGYSGTLHGRFFSPNSSVGFVFEARNASDEKVIGHCLGSLKGT